MRYWLRELAGWLIVGVGLLLIYLAYVMLEYYATPRILEAWPLVIAGIFVFRGGIHLLKVAVAARVCMQAQDRLYPAQETGVRSEGTGVQVRQREGVWK
jgi:hypothetical protein